MPSLANPLRSSGPGPPVGSAVLPERLQRAAECSPNTLAESTTQLVWPTHCRCRAHDHTLAGYPASSVGREEYSGIRGFGRGRGSGVFRSTGEADVNNDDDDPRGSDTTSRTLIGNSRSVGYLAQCPQVTAGLRTLPRSNLPRDGAKSSAPSTAV